MNIDVESLIPKTREELGGDELLFKHYHQKRFQALAILKVRLDDYKYGEYHHPDKFETMKERFNSTMNETDSATAADHQRKLSLLNGSSSFIVHSERFNARVGSPTTLYLAVGKTPYFKKFHQKRQKSMGQIGVARPHAQTIKRPVTQNLQERKTLSNRLDSMQLTRDPIDTKTPPPELDFASTRSK